MAPAMATRRLREELIKLKTQPPPGIIAEPDESNILKWFYVIRGPSDTPYEGGLYIGKLVFPSEYPMKAPSIHMLTPSGRFQINTKICMSMSDFHPESWNPMWSVATIIQGVQSFMASDELTTGGLRDSEANRKQFAKLSMAYNQKNYPNLFDGDIEGALETADEACQKAEEEAAKSKEEKTSSRRSRRAKKTESSEPDEPCKEPEENPISNNNGSSEPKLSRRQRRLLAQKAAEEQPDNEEEETNNDEDEEPEVAQLTQELSEAEIEKRRKRNAKKRAKQKAKKAAEST